MLSPLRTLLLIILYLLLLFIVPKCFKFLILKISQIKCSKTEMGKRLNIIVSFLYENEIELFKINYQIKCHYLFFNKLNVSNSMKIGNITPKSIKIFHEDCIDELIEIASNLKYDRDYDINKDKQLIQLIKEGATFKEKMKICSTIEAKNRVFQKKELRKIYEDCLKYNAYKEIYLLESWLLQMAFLVIKTKKSKISKEQYEVYELIKNEIDKIKDNELNLKNEEDEKLFKAFQVENDKFNNWVKNIYY